MDAQHPHRKLVLLTHLFLNIIVTMHDRDTGVRWLFASVADPDPNPSNSYVFGPPGSGSGSFDHQAKIVRKTLISTAL